MLESGFLGCSLSSPTMATFERKAQKSTISSFPMRLGVSAGLPHVGRNRCASNVRASRGRRNNPRLCPCAPYTGMHQKVWPFFCHTLIHLSLSSSLSPHLYLVLFFVEVILCQGTQAVESQMIHYMASGTWLYLAPSLFWQNNVVNTGRKNYFASQFQRFLHIDSWFWCLGIHEWQSRISREEAHNGVVSYLM